MKYEYRGIYKNYDMNGTLKFGGGKVKVHDIFNPLPEFMKEADCLFVDPPCDKGNLNCFYTKAEKNQVHDSYTPFVKRLFECIDEINPKIVFMEVFAVNREYCEKQLAERYKYIHIYDSFYYNSKDKPCWIIQASNEDVVYDELNGIDESRFVKKMCKIVDFECIADPCMGQGVVGRSAFDAGKRFVGTELNFKRLAVLVDYCVKKGAVLEYED